MLSRTQIHYSDFYAAVIASTYDGFGFLVDLTGRVEIVDEIDVGRIRREGEWCRRHRVVEGDSFDEESLGVSERVQDGFATLPY